MPRGLRFSTAVHRTFSNNFRTRKNPISQARKRPGSYPILPPPRAIPNPIPTTPKPDLPVKNGDPGLKTGYFFTLVQMRCKRRNRPLERSPAAVRVSRRAMERKEGWLRWPRPGWCVCRGAALPQPVVALRRCSCSITLAYSSTTVQRGTSAVYHCCSGTSLAAFSASRRSAQLRRERGSPSQTHSKWRAATR
eukprot:COSAG04_NODE_5552_length_1572_cov_2.000679_2_plen_193_part_00